MSLKLDRRHFLGVAGALGLRFALASASALRGEQKATPERRLFVIGGNAFDGALPPHLLLRYMLSMTKKNDPTVCYLPTAKGDSAEMITRWYETMNEFKCRPRHLRLFGNSSQMKNLDKRLLSADAIFVGGGNTLNMLAIWKAQGVDKILRQAWEKGILLAGESAGMICWFEQGVTDSRPGKISLLDGLGFLKGSACPHYHDEPDRKPVYQEMVRSGEAKDGVACDDGVGLLYEGDSLTRAVRAARNGKATRVLRQQDKVIEEPIKVELLGK